MNDYLSNASFQQANGLYKDFFAMNLPGLLIFSCFVLGLMMFPPAAFGGTDGPQTFSWTFLVFGLLGGLAFFLYGMDKMSEGLKKTAGDKMRSILAALTKNRFIGLLVGAFVTMVIQSSSATTVMLVSFVQAQLMTFVQTLGVILGADIGTTVTAQLIAFKLTDYALLMVAIGFSMRMFAKKDKIKDIGDIILGFGILFFGMKLMSDAMKPLRTYPGFIDLMQGLENPILGLLVGTVFTALVQSSSATTGVVIVLAQQGLITLEAGIPLIFGANLGTCVTAGLASIGTSREAKRVAMAHVLFKLAGVLLFIFWIPAFADIIRSIAERFGSGTARQIANAHTLFNVSLGLFFLPFTGFFAMFILKIFPKKPEQDLKRLKTWHLDESMIATPGFAIDLARTEVARMAKIIGRMVDAIFHPFLSDEPMHDKIFPDMTIMEGLDLREDKIDYLEERITDYLMQVISHNPTREQAGQITGMLSMVKDMESIGDIVHRDMIPLISKKQALEKDFSEEGKKELMKYHKKVHKQITRLVEALTETDYKITKKIVSKEGKYQKLESDYRSRHINRFMERKKASVETHEVHMDLMDMMNQVNVYTGNIAKTFLNSFQIKKAS